MGFRLYSRETNYSQNRSIYIYAHAHLRILLGIFDPHTSLYVNLTILRTFYGIICACANSVYRAVFSSPAKKGLGTRLVCRAAPLGRPARAARAHGIGMLLHA